jgi:hypothetical protein
MQGRRFDALRIHEPAFCSRRKTDEVKIPACKGRVLFQTAPSAAVSAKTPMSGLEQPHSRPSEIAICRETLEIFPHAGPGMVVAKPVTKASDRRALTLIAARR